MLDIKTAEDKIADCIINLQGRIDVLESEIEKIKSERCTCQIESRAERYFPSSDYERMENWPQRAEMITELMVSGRPIITKGAMSFDSSTGSVGIGTSKVSYDDQANIERRINETENLDFK